MKKTSFAMFIVPGLLAASFACVAPAMAEENNDGIPMGSVLADNSSMGSSNSQNNSNSGSDNSSMDNSNNDNSGSSNSSDQGSPDTATGDDDY